MTASIIDHVPTSNARVYPVPLTRVVNVELRKMFDTRSGFWLMASIVITGLLTMIGTVAFAPDADLTYYTFAKAIGFPMTVVLPIIAILSITSEWSQRSGLTTFTLVPTARVIPAKGSRRSSWRSHPCCSRSPSGRRQLGRHRDRRHVTWCGTCRSRRR